MVDLFVIVGQDKHFALVIFFSFAHTCVALLEEEGDLTYDME